MKDRLLGELIGLARATDGNEHLISESSTATVVACLSALDRLDTAMLESLLQRVEAEKRRMVPNCFCCAAPCGRNNACDLRQLQQEEPVVRQRKQQLLKAIQTLAEAGRWENAGVFYTALIAIGIEGIAPEVLDSVLHQVQTK